VVDDLAEVVAALDLVLDLAEDLANLVFDGVGVGGPLLESAQVGKEFVVDELAEVVAGHCLVVVELGRGVLGGVFGRGPAFPAVIMGEDVGLLLAGQGGCAGFVAFEVVEVFEEEQPGGLLGVVEFSGASGFFAEDVVDVFEGLLEHGHLERFPSKLSLVEGFCLAGLSASLRLVGGSQKVSPATAVANDWRAGANRRCALGRK
jgi:hypothetical protein